MAIVVAMKLSRSAFPVLVPISFIWLKISCTNVVTYSYAVMITVRSLQVIVIDLFTLRPSRVPSEPERPLRRFLSFSSSVLRAELDSTLFIRASRSAICFSVSSRRFETDISAAVVPGKADDVDKLETDEVLSQVVPKEAKVEVAGQEVGKTEAASCSVWLKQYSSISGSSRLVYTQLSKQFGSGFSNSSTFSWYSPFKLSKLPSASCGQEL